MCAKVNKNLSNKMAKLDITSKQASDVASIYFNPKTKDYYYCIQGFLNLIHSCGVRVWGLRVVNVRKRMGQKFGEGNGFHKILNKDVSKRQQENPSENKN